MIEPADEEEAAEMSRRRRERGETRFDSISEEIKALNSGLISEPTAAPTVDNRQPCPQCGRKFLPDRLQRHVKVCEDLKRGKEWRGTVRRRRAYEPRAPARAPAACRFLPNPEPARLSTLGNAVEVALSGRWVP